MVKSVEYMAAHGVTQFVELGPKDAVAGMIRRINTTVAASSIGDATSIKTFVEAN
jgi:malonyl CoA-acyl carrier protein transacylase